MSEPYFFEKQFPSSYYLCFAPPIQHHSGVFPGHPREHLDKATYDKDGYHVFIDVKDFSPDEISVKTINETIIVEGKQEKKPGTVPRHFVRHFRLPEFHDSEDVFSSISDDGILEVRALPAHQKRYHRNVAVKSSEGK